MFFLSRIYQVALERNRIGHNYEKIKSLIVLLLALNLLISHKINEKQQVSHIAGNHKKRKYVGNIYIIVYIIIQTHTHMYHKNVLKRNWNLIST